MDTRLIFVGEEITRLEKRNKQASEQYTKVDATPFSDADWEAAFNQCEPIIYRPIGIANDLLINEVYDKERGARTIVYGIQLDEMWSFVQNKKNKQWIWIALNPDNRQIVAFHVGSRSKKDAETFYNAISNIFKQDTAFFSQITGKPTLLL